MPLPLTIFIDLQNVGCGKDTIHETVRISYQSVPLKSYDESNVEQKDITTQLCDERTINNYPLSSTSQTNTSIKAHQIHFRNEKHIDAIPTCNKETLAVAEILP